MLVARFSLGSMPQLLPCVASHVSQYIGAYQGQGELKSLLQTFLLLMLTTRPLQAMRSH